jgi:aspartate/methionine/tyrosine aminotransferase
VVESFQTDISPIVAEYEKRRDLAVRMLREVTDVTLPGGAFYVFPKVPGHLGLTATQFVDRCIERNVLVIPGNAFSQRDTHIRVSLAASMDRLEKGLEIVCGLMR